MKVVIPSLICALVVFLVVAVLVSSRPASPDPELSRFTKRVEEQLVAMDAGLARISERMAALEEEVGSRSLGDGASSPQRVATTAGESGEDLAAREALPASGAAKALLAGLQEGEEQNLRQFVANVIEQDRVERREKQQLEQKRRMEEMREFQKGPYGKHNYKVNSLAKRLNMTDAQKQSYYNILVEYQSRFQDLRKGVKWRDREARDAYQESRKLLQQEYEGAVNVWLSPDQQAEYNSLSSWERNAEGGGAYMFGFDGGDAQVTSFVSSTDGAMELEAPPFVIEGDATGAVGAISISVGGPGAGAATDDAEQSSPEEKGGDSNAKTTESIQLPPGSK